MSGAVTREQRHTRAHRCPICGGADGDPRGQGKRCSGYTSRDGEWCRCSREEHAGALSADDHGLFVHRLRGPCKCGATHGPASVTQLRSEIVATYDYTDERGTLLYQVVRLAPKSFRQRRPDGAGGWTWQLGDVRRVLYRLRDLVEDDADRTVYLVEGEKDADALAKRGYLATCNPMGAGKWRHVAEHAREVLRDRDVVVVADADDVGRRHALEVADSLRGVVRSLVTMECPAPHKDVSDLLAARGQITDLVPLRPDPSKEKKEAKESPTDPAAPIDAWSSRLVQVDSSWLTEEPPPREYLMRDTRTGRGAIPASGAALLVAAGGAGKSFVAVAAAIAVATCTPWLGVMHPTSAGRALIISAEEPADEIRRRVYDIATEHGIQSIPDGAIDIIDIHDAHVPLLSPDARPSEHAHALVDLVRRRGPYALVIVDPLARISGASIDGDNVAACALITALESVASAAGGLVLGVHHTSQTARRAGIVDATAIRGATGLGDSARLVLVLTVESVDVADTPQWADLGEIVTITRAKANHVGRWEPIQLRRGDRGVLVPLDRAEREIVLRAREASDPAARRARRRAAEGREQIGRVAGVITAILSRKPEGMTYRELRAAARAELGECGDTSLEAALAYLGDHLATEPGPRRSIIHRLAATSQEVSQ